MGNAYNQLDFRALPAYSLADVARYIHTPENTVRSWVRGRKYRVSTGEERTFQPLTQLPSVGGPGLSFYNLCELHLLTALRQRHNVPIKNIRAAVEYVTTELGTRHPLANAQFKTDGVSLFVERLGVLENASQHGQLAMQEILERYLQRVDFGEDGLAARLFPFLSRPTDDDDGGLPLVEINPLISFGRPVLSGTGIPVDILAGRIDAGDLLDEVADDYDLPLARVRAAVDYQHSLAA